MVAVVDYDKCKGSSECADVCPTTAITIVDGQAKVDESICEDCGECAYVCPEKAITMAKE